MTKLNKNISFGIAKEDKIILKEKSKELGLSLSAMIRNIVLEKYSFLQVGYLVPGAASHDINIKGLKKPSQLTLKKRPPSRSDAYIRDLKDVFTNLTTAGAEGISILEKIEKSGMKVKGQYRMLTDDELKQALRDKDVRIFLKKWCRAYRTLLSKC